MKLQKLSFILMNLVACLFPFIVSGGILGGVVTDEHRQPMPYAAVYIEGTTKGTATNLKGVYNLTLEPGNYRIVFQFIGYKKRIETVVIGQQPVTLNVRMEPEEITLSEVVINSEDPAYGIIRKTIARKEHYLLQVARYQCKVFSKSVFRLTNAPEKLFGEKILDGTDTLGGIFYLSESESEISYQRPDKIHEVMISSKVSGSDNGFSFNYYSFFMMSFYKNLIQPPISNKRGYVSPLSDNAMMYYRYQLEGSFEEAGHTVFKIRVIPKRTMDPVFGGYLYIQDHDYRIHSVDLALGKGAGINFVDSLRISQQYFPVSDTTWMIFSQKIRFYFSLDFFGKKFGGNGIFHSQNTGYNLDVDFPKGYFTREYIRVNSDANKKDSAYWSGARPIPLTMEETSNYHRKDSIEKRQNTKEYLDSVNRRQNKPRAEMIWSGYTYNNRAKGITHTISAPLFGIQFNTIQGWNFGMNYTLNVNLKEGKYLRIIPDVVYGFSDVTWRVGLASVWYYNTDHLARFRLEGGIHSMKQFNSQDPIGPLVNSLYSIIMEENYLKAYDKTFIRISHRREIARGLQLTAMAEFARRAPLLNHQNSPVTDISGRRFTSNDPKDPTNYEPSFEAHNALIVTAGLTYTFGVRYMYLPRKTTISGRYPTIQLSVSQGIPDVLNSATRFTYLEGTVTQNIRCGLAGQLHLNAGGGVFLDRQPEYFIDYKHFNGNRTIFADTRTGAYQLMDYYSYSTDNYYVGLHLEQYFNGWILHKIPLLKKTKLREIIGLHYLNNDRIANYWEASFGIDNIFKTIRIDYILGFDGGTLIRNGVVLRIPFVNKGRIGFEF